MNTQREQTKPEGEKMLSANVGKVMNSDNSEITQDGNKTAPSETKSGEKTK